MLDSLVVDAYGFYRVIIRRRLVGRTADARSRFRRQKRCRPSVYNIYKTTTRRRRRRRIQGLYFEGRSIDIRAVHARTDNIRALIKKRFETQPRVWI